MRPHHYQFAHKALPAHFFNDVAQFSKLLKMDGKIFLHYLWTTVGEDLDEDKRLAYELGLESRKHGKYDLNLITMPTPIDTPEAFYVLLATDGQTHSYFTLELSKTDDADLALLCEWAADGSHQNYGQLGSSDVELFVRKCVASLK